MLKKKKRVNSVKTANFAYIYTMKIKSTKTIQKDFIPDREIVIRDSIESLRNSFEIEGIFFTDQQLQEMVDKVFAKEKLISTHL